MDLSGWSKGLHKWNDGEIFNNKSNWRDFKCCRCYCCFLNFATEGSSTIIRFMYLQSCLQVYHCFIMRCAITGVLAAPLSSGRSVRFLHYLIHVFVHRTWLAREPSNWNWSPYRMSLGNSKMVRVVTVTTPSISTADAAWTPARLSSGSVSRDTNPCRQGKGLVGSERSQLPSSVEIPSKLA